MMSADIVSALDLDKETPDGRVIVVREFGGCESSFITSSIIAHQVKSKCPILLISFHQLIDYYHNAGLRMGYNLKSQLNSGLLQLISPGELFLKSLFEDKTTSYLSELELLIETSVNKISQQCYSGNACVYVDGLMHLFDLGYTLTAVNMFARKIIASARKENCFIVISCAVATNEDKTAVMSGLLSHMAYTVVECDNLSSGRSADVSGHLNVKHPGKLFEPETSRLMQAPSRKYHFRLFDRGVKLFAPGTVGI